MSKLHTLSLIFFFKLFFYSSLIFGQKQNNNWYFGKDAGITFNTPTATALTNGKIYAREGCSSISDANGNLLFYTSGDTVYTKNFTPMPNGTGLNGGKSSTQGALIVPMPGSSTRYYIFTTGDQESGGTNLSTFTTPGLQYSIVDMSLNNGLGDVDVAFKNVSLFTMASEKVCATKHANGTDVWIITHDYNIPNSGNGDRFLAYLLTSSGISNTPVITKIGRRHTFYNSINNRFNMIGHLVVSPDGSKIATCVSMDGFAQLFDFDNSTGVLSNPINLGSFSKPYGLCFSPDSKLLYLTTSGAMKRDIANNFQYYRDSLLQFNLLASNISASKTVITQEPNRTFGALQLAPDGKIYIAQYFRNNPNSFFNVDSPYGFLSVINNPNGVGNTCNFVLDGFNLSGKLSLLGLPQNVYLTQCNVQLAVNPDTILCSGNTVTLTASGATNYSWFPSGGLNNTTGSTVTATINANTTYTVVGTDGLCSDTLIINLYKASNPLSISLISKQDPTCNQNNGSISVAAQGGFGNYNYSWTPNVGNTPTVSNLAAGNYQVTVTDSLGCSTTLNNITLNGSTPIITDIIFSLNPSACGASDGSAVINVISGGQGPFTYSWNTLPAQLDSHLTGVPAGVYICFVTDANGCITSDTVSLINSSPVITTISTNNPTCFGSSDGSITVSLSPSSSTIIWNNNPLLNDTQLTNLSAGTYIGIATDGSCNSNVTITLTDPNKLIATPTVTNQVLCFGGNTGSASASAIGGTLPYSFVWLPMNTNAPSINNLSAGNYLLVVTDGVGCTDTTAFTITEPTSPLTVDSAIALNVSCFGLSDGAAQGQVNGGTLPYSYNWIGSTSTGISAINLAAGIYSLIVTDANNCKDTVNFIITEPPVLSVNTTASATAVCFGGSSVLTANATGGTTPYNYSWSTGQLTPTLTVNPASTTSYTVFVNDKNNCSASAISTISVLPAPVVNLINTDTLCVNGSKKITASGGTSYSWFPATGLNTTTGSTVIASPTSNTTYYVLVSNSIGCTTLDSVLLVIDNSVNASFTYEPSNPQTIDSVKFNNQSVPGNLTFVWDFGDNTPTENSINAIHNYLFEEEYSVLLTATNNRGCKDTAIRKITIKDVFEWEAPNIFTPNNDAKNDVFRFIKARGITDLTCEIYNRWGIRVYTFTGAKGQWEGYNQSGEACPDGIYYYIITLKTNTNETKNYSGYITLMR
jgi:gliding motility-associated-like protein